MKIHVQWTILSRVPWIQRLVSEVLWSEATGVCPHGGRDSCQRFQSSSGLTQKDDPKTWTMLYVCARYFVGVNQLPKYNWGLACLVIAVREPHPQVCVASDLSMWFMLCGLTCQPLHWRYLCSSAWMTLKYTGVLLYVPLCVYVCCLCSPYIPWNTLSYTSHGRLHPSLISCLLVLFG